MADTATALLSTGASYCVDLWEFDENVTIPTGGTMGLVSTKAD